jgi:hypothetical protein
MIIWGDNAQEDSSVGNLPSNSLHYVVKITTLFSSLRAYFFCGNKEILFQTILVGTTNVVKVGTS